MEWSAGLRIVGGPEERPVPFYTYIHNPRVRGKGSIVGRPAGQPSGTWYGSHAREVAVQVENTHARFNNFIAVSLRRRIDCRWAMSYPIGSKPVSPDKTSY
jgi:hypothetical protein